MKTNYQSIAGMFLLAVASASAQQNTLLLPDMTGAPGGSFFWPVSLSGASPVVGIQFDLKFPAGQMTVSSGVRGPDSLTSLANAREIAPGHARIAVTSAKNQPLPKTVVMEIPLGLPVGSPAGGPAFTVEKIILALADGTSVPAGRTFGPLTDWRTKYFTAAELLDGRLIGDSADPDDDGTVNVLEYAVGGNPRLSLPGERPTTGHGVLLEGGERKLFLALNYRRARNAPGVLFEPQVSENLRTWTAAGTVLTAGEGDAVSVPMQARVLVGEKKTQYLRLRVSRTGNTAP